MSNSETVPLEGELRRLSLAVGDMLQAEAAARLLELQTNVHARRALETAIAVCYARPWIASNKDGSLKRKWLPTAPDDRDLHELLLQRRQQTYAHTDPEGGRKSLVVLEASETAETVVQSLGEEWFPLSRESLPAIADLCARQSARFKARIVDMIDRGASGGPATL